MHIFLYQIPYFGQRALLNAYKYQVNDLINIDIVNMADEFFFIEFISQKTKEKKENSLSVGSQTNYL
jgi:hypothetical protein